MRFTCAFCSSRRLCTYVRDLDGLTYLHELLAGPFEHLEQPPEAVPKQISSFNTNNGLGRPKKGSRRNPPLSECRATPREWLAGATLIWIPEECPSKGSQKDPPTDVFLLKFTFLYCRAQQQGCHHVPRSACPRGKLLQ